MAHQQMNGNAHMLDANLQTGRFPPSWSPDQERTYSLRAYRDDVMLWMAATDMDMARRGPALALRLGGDAKAMAIALGAAELTGGRVGQDNAGNPVLEDGPSLLLRLLARAYAALEQEEQLHAISAIMSFRRKQAESTDEVVSRFERLRRHADQAGGIVMPIPMAAWLVLSALGISRSAWPLLLAPTAGALPDTAH